MNVNNNRPFTVAPTNNGSSSNYRSYEYFDLDDIFEDDFFPPGLDFSDMLLPMESEQIFDKSDQQLSMPSSSVEPFPSSSSAAPNFAAPSLHPSTGYVKKEKKENDGSERAYYPYNNNTKTEGAPNKVIMIPPQMPKQQLVYKCSSTNISDKKVAAVKVESDGGSGPEQKKTTRLLRDSSEDESKVERRERNREHAKRSRIRKRLLLDSLQDQLAAVRNENVKLRRLVADKLPPAISQQVLMDCTTEESSLLKLVSGDRLESDSETVAAPCVQEVADNGQKLLGSSIMGPGDLMFSGSSAADSLLQGLDMLQQGSKKPSPLTASLAHDHPLLTSSIDALNQANVRANAAKDGRDRKLLMEPDYRLMESLVISQQNFVLSDPSLPDNPIVYCSDGFCKLSGYKRSEVVGRNCRFLQGPGTDQGAVDIIRQGVLDGRDISVCLLNYKADATPFWNQFFVAPIKDEEGAVVNYVGVQCEVNTMPIHEIKERVKKLPIPTDSYTMKQLNESSTSR